MWKWNVFDLVLVLLMILETWVLALLKSGMSMNQLTLLRMLRMSRLMRISRIFRMVPELGMMVKSMAAAARSVSSALFLEIGLMYVFAAIFTQWAKSHTDPCFETVDSGDCILDEYFGSIAKSLVSLLQILVFDDAFAIIRPTIKDSWYMGYLLIIFICIGSFTVLNMLIGIICEIVSTTTMDEKEKMLQQRVRETFLMMDTDGSGCVTKEEFDDGARYQLLKLGIDREVVDNAFEIIDQDNTGEIELEEFLDMIFKLTHPPQTQDVLKLHTKMDKLFDTLYVAGVCDVRTMTMKSAQLQRKESRLSTTSLKNIKDTDKDALFKVKELAGKASRGIAKAFSMKNKSGTKKISEGDEVSEEIVSVVPQPQVSGQDNAIPPEPQDWLPVHVPGPNDTPPQSKFNQNGHVTSPGNNATSSAELIDSTEVLRSVLTPDEVQREALDLRHQLSQILGDDSNIDKALELVQKWWRLSQKTESDALLLEVEMSSLAGNEGVSALPILKKLLALGLDASIPEENESEEVTSRSA
jgi:hypothetical protein